MGQKLRATLSHRNLRLYQGEGTNGELQFSIYVIISLYYRTSLPHPQIFFLVHNQYYYINDKKKLTTLTLSTRLLWRTASSTQQQVVHRLPARWLTVTIPCLP
ncbi:unnamed protein product [Amoebophrya sp. A25]|nr:unnamed protein product [Amoebophrya sp. A25]|eukprot:GSA25T00011289001.1